MASPAEIIQLLLAAIVLVLSILGNTAIFYVILRVRRLHCPTGFLLVNLTVIDNLMAGILLPLRMLGILGSSHLYSKTTCAVIGFIQIVLSYACVLTVVAVSIDRYLAIVLPLRYKARVTVIRTTIAILCIWMYSIFCGCFPFLGWGSYSFIPGLWLCDFCIQNHGLAFFKLVTIYFLPLIIITCLYYKIWRVSKRHSKQIRREVEAMTFREASASVQVQTEVGKIKDVSGQFCLRQPHSALRSEVKTALTLGFVAGALFISWAPYMAVTIWASSTSNTNQEVYEWSSIVYFLSIMINPYIYGYLNRTIKSQVKNYANHFIEWVLQVRTKTNKVTPAIIVISPGDDMVRSTSFPATSGVS